MARETIYEPHPVSPERKAELQAKGYRIVDARFAPADAKVEPAPAPAPVEIAAELTPELTPEPAAELTPEPKRRGRPAKVVTEAEISDKAEASSEE